MNYFATDNALEIMNDFNIVTEFMIEREIDRKKKDGFSFENMIWLDVKEDEDGNRYIFHAVKDLYDEGYKKCILEKIKFVGSMWIKVNEET